MHPSCNLEGATIEEANQLTAVRQIPKYQGSQVKNCRSWWSTVLNAAERSNRLKTEEKLPLQHDWRKDRLSRMASNEARLVRL